MAERVVGFRTADGKFFDDAKTASAHEKVLVLGAAVAAALTGLGFAEAQVVVEISGEDRVEVPLQDFLLANSEQLVVALTAPKKERKPRAPKEELATGQAQVTGGVAAGVAPEAPVVEAAPETPAAEPVAEVEAPSSDAELEALLGTSEVQV